MVKTLYLPSRIESNREVTLKNVAGWYVDIADEARDFDLNTKPTDAMVNPEDYSAKKQLAVMNRLSNRGNIVIISAIKYIRLCHAGHDSASNLSNDFRLVCP